MDFTNAYGKSNRGQSKFEPYQNRLVCTYGKSYHADNPEGDIDLDVDQGRIVPKTDPALLTTLTDKLKWLKDELNLHLDHDNRGELEQFADVLIEYRAVFGVGDDNLGTFPHEVEIPTNGESRSAKPHNIPHAHQKIITAEIEKMLKAGFIELCEDPKGFSSPIVTVKKKDGSVRMCMNFKPTLNQVLKDGETFPMESTDGVFAKIPKCVFSAQWIYVQAIGTVLSRQKIVIKPRSGGMVSVINISAYPLVYQSAEICSRVKSRPF